MDTRTATPADTRTDTRADTRADTAAANRMLALRWMNEIWNERRLAIMEELVTPHSVGHSDGMPDIVGLEGARAYCGALCDAFPDLRLDVEDTVAEGDNVVVRWHVRATHGGRGLGIEPTQRPVTFRGMSWLRFQDGKIVEGWDAWNSGGVVQRLSTPA